MSHTSPPAGGFLTAGFPAGANAVTWIAALWAHGTGVARRRGAAAPSGALCVVGAHGFGSSGSHAAAGEGRVRSVSAAEGASPTGTCRRGRGGDWRVGAGRCCRGREGGGSRAVEGGESAAWKTLPRARRPRRADRPRTPLRRISFSSPPRRPPRPRFYFVSRKVCAVAWWSWRREILFLPRIRL